MARVCDVTGKGPMVGNNVSHANNKTKRRFLPNLQYRRFWVETENRWVRLRVSGAALRLIDKNGIDAVLADLRARINTTVAGRRFSEVADALAGLTPAFPEDARAVVTAVAATLLETLVERQDERLAVAGTANLARFTEDFDSSIKPVLEALEEQVVLLRLLGEATSPSMLTVRIGHENPYHSLSAASVVSVGYGRGDQALGTMGVLGPTRMDYPGTMAAVGAVARYVSQILAGN